MIQFSVLPTDILQSLSITLDKGAAESRGNLGLSYLSLPHPRTGLPSLYLPIETPNASKILEVQAVAPPNERSWFLDEEIVSDGRLLLMTPVDPAFFLIYMLQLQQTENTPGQFRPADDILEEVATSIAASSQSKMDTKESDKDPTISSEDILRFASMPCSKDALKYVCDVKEITTDIVVYRYSPTKVINYLRTKVERLASPEVLECSRTIIRGLARDGLMEDGNEELLQLGRTRAACDLLGQYLPQAIRAQLDQSYNYTKLDDYLQKSTVVVPMMAPQKGLKKTTSTEGPADSKKRKNAKGSQGVEKLKKASIKGMAKLSDLFQKKVPAA